MNLDRKIQQLRNDGDDEFADAVQGLVDFRFAVAAALAELRAEMTERINRQDDDRIPPVPSMVSKRSAEHWRDRLDATIAKLGLQEAE